MRRSITVFLLLIATLDNAQALTLREAEALWQEHSHELGLARSVVTGATADLQTAGQRPNPELSLNTLSISPSEGYGPGQLKDKRMDTQLRLEQLIERGGKRELRTKGAEARLDAARFDLDDTMRQQLGTLRSAYYNLRLAQERLALTRETAELQARTTDAARRREKAGDLAPVDLARLQIDQSRAESEAREAEADLEQARQLLAYLIGREQESRQLVADDTWPALEEQALNQTPLEQRPDLEAARRRLAAAEADRDLARARRTRDVSVGVQLERNLQNAPTNSFGVGISVPLFVWHEYEGEIARAETDFTIARQQYEQQKAQALGLVEQARSTLLAARDRCRRLDGSLLADAQRVAKAAELAYAKGALGLIDLLDARRTLRQVQIEAATARADYAKALSEWQLQAEYRKQQ